MNDNRLKSILLFKLRYIGDVLLTTPAIRLVRKSHPQARITMVVNKGTEDVLRHNPHLDRVLTIDRSRLKGVGLLTATRYEWRFLNVLRERPYDVSIDFGSGDRAAILSLLAGAPSRFSPYSRGLLRRLIYSRQVRPPRPMHMLEMCLLLLRETLGLEATDTALVLHTGPDDEEHAQDWLARNHLQDKPFAVVHVGARYPQNRWPPENWAALADALQGDAGLKTVFVGATQDSETIRQIAARMDTPVLSAVGETTVLQLAALLRRAAVFVGHDSGPMHVATAVGTRAVALFGPTSSPVYFRPWGDGHVVIESGANVPMTNIKVADVLSAVSKTAQAR